MMSDPYKTLGVERNASEDEIKSAYRTMCRKYHPDVNPGNPSAEEMFKEVQQAYQQIMKEKKDGLSGGYGDFYGAYENEDSEYATHMNAAANYIRSGMYNEALNVLEGISERTAQWYYYSAVTSSGLGNNVAALQYAKMAASMEPGNMEYQVLVQRLEYGSGWYETQQSPYRTVNLGGNDFCCKLCLANLFCSTCCGGRVCCC